MNIAIIGAGPIGNYAGYLLAKQGHQVNIYEEHPQIGNPIQCTGLLSSDFDKFNLPTKDFLVNTFSKITVSSPKHQTTIPQKEYLVCRTKFDQFFGKLAQKAGAKIHLQHSFLRKEESKDNKDGSQNPTLIIKNLRTKKEISIQPDIVIAADGPLSKTAKAYNFYHKKRENYFGIQAVIKGDFSDHQAYTALLSQSLCPDLFAWIVPESKTTARVGLGSKKNSRQLFDKFMEQHNFKKDTIQEMQAGTIPVYHPRQRLQKENCYLLGDAAGQVKATTLGGLVPGLDAAQILAKCIESKGKDNQKKGKDYKRALAPIRRRLWLHLKLRNILDKFGDEDWDKLLSLVKQEKIKKVLSTYARDNPIPLVTQLLLREPRFLYFVKYLF